MPKIETGFPQEPVLIEDRYPATLKDVQEYTSIYEGVESQRLAWIFDVVADEDAIDDSIEIEIEGYEFSGHFEVARHTSFATGPKSNMRPLLEALVGEVPQKLDTDDLIGLPCIVDVTSYETKGGQIRNVIEKVRPPKKGQQRGRPKSPALPSGAADVDESDFDDIPI